MTVTSNGTSQRVIPHSLEAEGSLLGAMLLSRDAIAEAVQVCDAGDFYRPVHGHIFDAIVRLWAKGEPADPVTVYDELAKSGLAADSGNLAGLLSLQVNTPATSNAVKYARIVFEHSQRRRLIAVAGEVADLGYQAGNDLADSIDRAEELLFAVADTRSAESTKTVDMMMTEAVEHLQVLADRDGRITGVPTGFRDLDEQLLGLQPSSLVIVGARPAMGKSAFALNIALSAAARARVQTLFFSLEMSHAELSQRMLAAEASVDFTHLRTGRLSDDEWSRLSLTIGTKLAAAPLYIDDNPNLTLMDIRAKARRMKSKIGNLGLVVIDYIQLMTGRHNAESRQVEVSEISRGLKVLARELDVPVLALSQLSRQLEMRADKRPMLADLRESGSLEQDADVVMFIYREEVYTPTPENSGLAEVIVAKHRNGPTGVCPLAYLSRYTRFKDMARGGF